MRVGRYVAELVGLWGQVVILILISDFDWRVNMETPLEYETYDTLDADYEYDNVDLRTKEKMVILQWISKVLKVLSCFLFHELEVKRQLHLQ